LDLYSGQASPGPEKIEAGGVVRGTGSRRSIEPAGREPPHFASYRSLQQATPCEGVCLLGNDPNPLCENLVEFQLHDAPPQHHRGPAL
jgi:hypothetical protein